MSPAGAACFAAAWLRMIVTASRVNACELNVSGSASKSGKLVRWVAFCHGHTQPTDTGGVPRVSTTRSRRACACEWCLQYHAMPVEGASNFLGVVVVCRVEQPVERVKATADRAELWVATGPSGTPRIHSNTRHTRQHAAAGHLHNAPPLPALHSIVHQAAVVNAPLAYHVRPVPPRP